MPTIATNIFKELTLKEKKEIKKVGKPLGSIEIYDYIEKGMGLEKIIKFIFDGFVLKDIIREVLLWDAYKSLFRHIFNSVAKKYNKPTEIQIWIRDTSNPTALNIVFSIRQEVNIQDLLAILRTKIEEDIFSKNKDQEKGKIFWIAFDKETQTWLIKIL